MNTPPSNPSDPILGRESRPAEQPSATRRADYPSRINRHAPPVELHPFVSRPWLPGRKRKPGHRRWFLGAMVLFCLVTYYAVSRYVVSAVVVQGKSMLPTLREGERYLLNRWSFQFRPPQRGDLVVIQDPGHSDFAVKRIVGLPMDEIEFKDGEVYLNGRVLRESYLASGTRTVAPKGKTRSVVLGANQYFVLGDNRPLSEDSRYYGPIARDKIIGVIEN